MSDSSLEENGAANLEDFEFNPNKRQSEKKRREQENLYLEELSQLINANFPELRNVDVSRLLMLFFAVLSVLARLSVVDLLVVRFARLAGSLTLQR
jgi:hypothetical protein